MWDQNKQLNVWNIDIESIKAWEKKLNKQTSESSKEINKIKNYGFRAIVCVRKNKPACAGKIMRIQVLAQKALKVQPS